MNGINDIRMCRFTKIMCLYLKRGYIGSTGAKLAVAGIAAFVAKQMPGGQGL